jgi:hypothetical protein
MQVEVWVRKEIVDGVVLVSEIERFTVPDADLQALVEGDGYWGEKDLRAYLEQRYPDWRVEIVTPDAVALQEPNVEGPNV